MDIVYLKYVSISFVKFRRVLFVRNIRPIHLNQLLGLVSHIGVGFSPGCSFQCSPLLTFLGKQQRMVPVLGFLNPHERPGRNYCIWPGTVLAVTESESTMENLCLSLCFKKKENIKLLINHICKKFLLCTFTDTILKYANVISCITNRLMLSKTWITRFLKIS